MTHEYELDQFEAGGNLFFVRVSAEILPRYDDETGYPNGYDMTLSALEVAEWGPEDVGPAMAPEAAQAWLQEHYNAVEEAVENLQEAAYVAHEERKLDGC